MHVSIKNRDLQQEIEKYKKFLFYAAELIDLFKNIVPDKAADS